MTGADARSVDNLRAVADEMLSALQAGGKIMTRARFNASLMERVPESARQLLGGVRADSVLRHRILTSAMRSQSRTAFGSSRGVGRGLARRLAPVFSLAMGLVLIAVLGTRWLMDAPQIPATDLQANPTLKLESFSAGDLNTGMLRLAGGVPQYRTLFARTSTGDPALLSVNGRYYQMLDAPNPLPDRMLGQKHGDVQPLTADISLADRVGVLSNVVPEGEVVCGIEGYSTRTMVAARVGGVMRVFQRVGYAVKTLVGGESFRDTLDVSGKVAALELSGVGVISDVTKANELIGILLRDAEPWSGESISDSGQALTIYLDGDIVMQLNVSGEIVQACGAWACPSFFEAYEAAAS